MLNQSHLFLHLLNSFPGFGPVRLNKLLKYFDSPQQAFQASREGLLTSGLEKNLAEKFINFRGQLNPELEMEKLKLENINIISILDEDYPSLLREISTPPAILYYKGSKPGRQKISCGVVGSRNCSPYGEQVINSLLPPIFKNYEEKVTIVSGLAMGIDSLAHSKTVSCQEKTIAVLGCGLDEKTIFPRQNRILATKILATEGTLLSEFPPKTPPLKHHFPQRNRIVSGLSQALLVIEALERSGALITANWALEQNRDILAVPGSIFSPTSQGTNQLIQKGAQPITKASDLALALNLTQKQTSSSTQYHQSNLLNKN